MEQQGRKAIKGYQKWREKRNKSRRFAGGNEEVAGGRRMSNKREIGGKLRKKGRSSEPKVGEVTLKSNDDETLSDESL